MNPAGSFPFGQPILPVSQKDRSQKDVFILGVYASAVHAKWLSAEGKPKIAAVAVASEPEIFWDGNETEASEIIGGIEIPREAGSLVPVGKNLNGPSGRALDKFYLSPLGLTRDDVWLSDLVPYSCMNGNQRRALEREYNPIQAEYGLPDYNWQEVPKVLATEERAGEILSEVKTAQPKVLITLGDQPLKWFAKRFGAKASLRSYGASTYEYGKFHTITVDGLSLRLLPLVHPRQAARLGGHSPAWSKLHESWIEQNPSI